MHCYKPLKASNKQLYANIVVFAIKINKFLIPQQCKLTVVTQVPQRVLQNTFLDISRKLSCLYLYSKIAAPCCLSVTPEISICFCLYTYRSASDSVAAFDTLTFCGHKEASVVNVIAIFTFLVS